MQADRFSVELVYKTQHSVPLIMLYFGFFWCYIVFVLTTFIACIRTSSMDVSAFYYV